MALLHLYISVSFIVALVHCEVNNDEEAGKDILTSTEVGIQIQNLFAADCKNIKGEFESIRTSLIAQDQQLQCSMSSVDEIYEIANETSESFKKQNTQVKSMVSSVASLESKLVKNSAQLKSFEATLKDQDDLLQALTAQVETYISELADTSVVDTVLKCPEGFDEFQENCYKYYQTYKNWYEASEICKTVNGILAEPRSEAENGFIESKYFTDLNDPYMQEEIWIGGTTDISGEYGPRIISQMARSGKEWNWASDGSRIADGYHNWREIPDTGIKEGQPRCAELVLDSHARQWQYDYCYYYNAFVCQTTKVHSF